MKLQPDQSPQQTILALGPNGLLTSHGHTAELGAMLTSEGFFEALSQPAFVSSMTSELNRLPLVTLEVLILGSGQKHHLFPPSWRGSLNNPILGIESMSTPAACRTFNVLSLEGRKVALWVKL
jgi:uncharacterized protein